MQKNKALKKTPRRKGLFNASSFLFLCFLAASFCRQPAIPALQADTYRLLSISQSEKLILVSRLSDKAKYLLDASSAKISLNKKAAELDKLEQYSVIEVKMKLKKMKKNGVELDGSAIEIRISLPTPTEPQI